MILLPLFTFVAFLFYGSVNNLFPTPNLDILTLATNMTQSFQQVNTLVWEPALAMINDQVQHACKNVNAPSAFIQDVGPQASHNQHPPSSIRRSRSYGSRNPDSSPPPTCPTPPTCRPAFFATATPTSVAPIPTATGLTTMSGHIETTRDLVLYESLPHFQSGDDDDDDDDEQHKSQWSNSFYLPHLHDQMFHHWIEVCAKWEAFVRWTKLQVKRVPFDKFKGVDMDDSTFDALMLLLMTIVIGLGCVWNKAGDASVVEEEARDEVISLESLDLSESSLQDGPSTQVDLDTTADVEQEHKDEDEVEALLLQLSDSDSDTACFHDNNPIPADIPNAIDGSPTPSAFEPELASLSLSPSPSLFAIPIPSESMYESSSSSSVHQDEDESNDNDIVPAPVSMSPLESTQIEFETTPVCEPEPASEPEAKCDFAPPIFAVGGPLADLFAIEDAACSAPASCEAGAFVEDGTDSSFNSLFDEKDGDDSREHQPDVAALNCLCEYDSEEEEEEDQQREVSAWNSLCEYDSEEEAEQPGVPVCECDSEDKEEQPQVSAWNALCQYDSEEEEEENMMSVSTSMSVDCVRCDEGPLFAAISPSPSPSPISIPQDATGWNSLCEYDSEEEEEIMSKSVSVDDGLLFVAASFSSAGMPLESEVQVQASHPNFDYLPPICAVADLSRDMFDLWKGEAAAASSSPAILPEVLVSDMISDSADTDRDTSFDSLFDEREGKEQLPIVAVEGMISVSVSVDEGLLFVAVPSSSGTPQDSEVQVQASHPNFDYLPPICAVADLSRDLFDLWQGEAAAASSSPATLSEALVSDMISDSADTDRDTSFDSLFDEREGEEQLPIVAVEEMISVSVSVDEGLLFVAVPSSSGTPQDSEVQVQASHPNFDYLPPICAVADLSRDLFDLWQGEAAAASSSPATLSEALVSDMISDSADTDRDTSFDSLFDEREEQLPTVLECEEVETVETDREHVVAELLQAVLESQVTSESPVIVAVAVEAVSEVISPDVVDVAEPIDVNAVVNVADIAEPAEVLDSAIVDAPEDVQEDDSSIEIGEDAGEPVIVEAKIPEVELSFSEECTMDISVDELAETADAVIVKAPEVEGEDDSLVNVDEEASEPATVPGDELSFAGEASMDISYGEPTEAVDAVIVIAPLEVEGEDKDDSSIQPARVDAKIPGDLVELSLAGEASMDMDISLNDQEVVQSMSTLAEPESHPAPPSMEAKGLQASMWAPRASDSQEKTRSWAQEVEEVETNLRASSSVNIETETTATNSDTTSHILTDRRQVLIANCDRIANLIAMSMADHKQTRRPVTSTQRAASADASGTASSPRTTRSAPTDENVPPSSSEEPKVSPHKKKSRGHRGGVAVRDRKAQVEARRLSRAVGNLLTVKN